MIRQCGFLIAKRPVSHALVLSRLCQRPEFQFKYEQRREFKNFGHKPQKIPKVSNWFFLFIGAGMVGSSLNWDM